MENNKNRISAKELLKHYAENGNTWEQVWDKEKVQDLMEKISEESVQEYLKENKDVSVTDVRLYIVLELLNQVEDELIHEEIGGRIDSLKNDRKFISEDEVKKMLKL